MMCSAPRSAASASGRSRPWVSEIMPIRMGFSVLSGRALLFVFHLLDELADADHCATYRAASNFLHVVAGGHTQRVETSVEGFEHSLRLDARSDAAGGAMFNVDGCSHSDLVAFTVRLQGVKRRGLHQADHVWRGIHGRQLGMVGRERVLEFDGLFGVAARPDGNLFSHSRYLSKRK